MSRVVVAFSSPSLVVGQGSSNAIAGKGSGNQYASPIFFKKPVCSRPGLIKARRFVRGNDALRELSSLGKNGSLFYLTNDMIKTMRKAEVKGEAKSAQLIGQAIANNPTFIILRKIEAAIEIVHTISNATNKVSLNSVVVEY
ncbi:uncharacterized protein LOC106764274 isoform X3 [Vigna radiata var. radiata]|uniref:Prohibitin n=1 Tax=Vigna radiata var. radiata TaxID=3916 RepID=A0A1S3UDL5_VIGRR|nr:uncharacterized protein LOC106764274 isoform X3 [Vigna radiata var. radiata]